MTNDVRHGRYFLNICAMESLMLFFSFSHSCLWWVIARASPQPALISFCFTFRSGGIRDRAWVSQYLMKTSVTRQARQGPAGCKIRDLWDFLSILILISDTGAAPSFHRRQNWNWHLRLKNISAAVSCFHSIPHFMSLVNQSCVMFTLRILLSQIYISLIRYDLREHLISIHLLIASFIYSAFIFSCEEGSSLPFCRSCMQ